MTHDATVELLSRYLDGDLDPGDRRRVETLIAEDSEALEVFEGLRRVRGSLAQLADTEPPPHLGVLVRRRLAVEAEESTLWRRVDGRLRRFLVEPSTLPVFAVILALAAMVYVLAHGLDRFERAREPVFLRPPAGAVQSLGPRELGGRTFEFQGDRWIEVGLSSEAAAGAPRTHLSKDEVAAWRQAHPTLEQVPQLGAVVLELEGAVVELIFERQE